MSKFSKIPNNRYFFHLLSILIIIFSNQSSSKLLSFQEGESPSSLVHFLQLKFITKTKSVSSIKSNTYSPTQFISEYLNNYIFTEVGTGTPSQTVTTVIDPMEKCFSLKYEELFTNLTQIFGNTDRIINFKYYNKSLSTSIFDHGRVIMEEFDYDYLSKFQDIFMFTNIDNSLTASIKLGFLYGIYNEFNPLEKAFGKIGLSLDSYGNKVCYSFIDELKKQGVIEKFTFNINFRDYDYGEINFGPEPHIYDKSGRFVNTNFFTKKVFSQEGKIFWGLSFDTVTYMKKNEQRKIELNEKIAKFNINKGVIIGTEEFRNFIENYYFNTLINKKICEKNIISSKEDEKKYILFSCKENEMKDVNSESFGVKSSSYIEAFPNIEFSLKDPNYTFKLIWEDLFRIIDGKIYFLIVFENDNKNNNNEWIMGQPFLRKYQLIFDMDKKEIGFYKGLISYDDDADRKMDNKEEDNNKDKKIFKTYILPIILVLLVIATVTVAFFLGMKIKESRKKRANELKDEDFDYNTYEKNENGVFGPAGN